MSADLAGLLLARFGHVPEADRVPNDVVERFKLLADRRTCRRFLREPVGEALMRQVLAVGLSAPSKSDLQQADVIWVRDPIVRVAMIRDCGAWIADPETGPAEILVVCGNGARFAKLFEGAPFPNDHFDALFNATGDAAILLAWLLVAAEMAGLGACPVSVMRNRVEEISTALGLPDRVFPFAGLALGWPAEPRAPISPRLGPTGQLHIDRFDAAGQRGAITAYDARRARCKLAATVRLSSGPR